MTPPHCFFFLPTETGTLAHSVVDDHMSADVMAATRAHKVNHVQKNMHISPRK